MPQETAEIIEKNIQPTAPVKQTSKLAIVLLIVSIIFLIVGGFKTYKVYDKDTEDFGIQAFNKVSERQLVEDATFSGTVRKGKVLYSTYDRSQPVGKKACPT